MKIDTWASTHLCWMNEGALHTCMHSEVIYSVHIDVGWYIVVQFSQSPNMYITTFISKEKSYLV